MLTKPCTGARLSDPGLRSVLVCADPWLRGVLLCADPWLRGVLVCAEASKLYVENKGEYNRRVKAVVEESWKT